MALIKKESFSKTDIIMSILCSISFIGIIYYILVVQEGFNFIFFGEINCPRGTLCDPAGPEFYSLVITYYYLAISFPIYIFLLYKLTKRGLNQWPLAKRILINFIFWTLGVSIAGLLHSFILSCIHGSCLSVRGINYYIFNIWGTLISILLLYSFVSGVQLLVTSIWNKQLLRVGAILFFIPLLLIIVILFTIK